jgi:hypothetical protein
MEVTYMLGLLKILSMFTVALGTVVPVIADGNMTTNRDKIAGDSEVDINKVYADALRYSYNISHSADAFVNTISNINSSAVSMVDKQVTKIGDDVVVDNDKAIYIGTSTLVNNDDIAQDLATQSFSETVSDELSTTTTKSINVDISAKFEIGGIETTITAEKSQTHTTTKTDTITSPSQLIKVPPHSTRKVATYLDQATIQSKVSLSAKFTGTISGALRLTNGTTVNWSTPLGYGVYCTKLLNGLPDPIGYSDDLKYMSFTGLTELVQANHGSHYSAIISKGYNND